jgi:predicted nucleic acid-binding protein
MPAERFLGTNVLLYGYDLDAPEKRRIAQASGARELLTEDMSHGQDYGGVRVVNPFK